MGRAAICVGEERTATRPHIGEDTEEQGSCFTMQAHEPRDPDSQGKAKLAGGGRGSWVVVASGGRGSWAGGGRGHLQGELGGGRGHLQGELGGGQPLAQWFPHRKYGAPASKRDRRETVGRLGSKGRRALCRNPGTMPPAKQVHRVLRLQGV